MPSGAKKRKAAKKKKVNDSSAPNPHQGENDPQGPSVEVVKREDGSSEPKVATIEEEGNVEIETVSKSKSSSGSGSSSSDSSDDEAHVVEKKVVVVESVPAVESLPESVSPVVELVKPDDSLVEQVSQVVDEIKEEEKKDLVVEETSVVEEQQTVEDCGDSSVVVESVLKEKEVENVQPLVEKASSESTDFVSSSTPPKDLVSDVNGAECANEIETAGHSDRQAPAASAPVAVQNTTSWKSCCGIFELFSGSGR